MNNAFIALGSNLKTPERMIRLAIKLISTLAQTHVLYCAPFYKNPAEGRRGAPDFVNTVLHAKTRLSPFELLRALQTIEKRLGRVRKAPWGPRTIDCDLIVYENRRMHHPKLTLPHPRFQDRAFVLLPLQACLQRENTDLHFIQMDAKTPRIKCYDSRTLTDDETGFDLEKSNEVCLTTIR